MTMYFIEKLENWDSTFRQRISGKEFKHNTGIYVLIFCTFPKSNYLKHILSETGSVFILM
jgi:hypothetical protein